MAKATEKTREIVVDGVTHLVGRGLVRTGNGWQARPSGAVSKYFSDSRLGGTALALEAARQFLVSFEQNAGPRPIDLERITKKIKTGQAGVFLSITKKPERKHSEIRYLVNFRGETKVVYVGTEATFQNRLEDKLNQAIALREAMVKASAAEVQS